MTDISSPSHPPFAPPSSSDTPALLAVPPLLSRAKPFRVSIRPPGSKSLTNRALLLAALARGDSVIRRPLLEADDAQRMIAAVTTLGAKVTRSGQDLKITGVNGRWVVPPEGVTLDLGNAGTATRFLAAAALLAPGPVTVDGNARMRQRPIAELAGALIHLHANIEFTGTKGCPPMKIVPPRGPAGEARALVLPTTMSSQFISALLLVAPWLAHDVTIKLVGEITSASYITMTIGLLQKLGAHVQMTEDLRVTRVGPPRAVDGRSRGFGLDSFTYDTEPDASGATYFWAAAALIPGAVCKVQGLGPGSLQGDAAFPELLVRMGASSKPAGTDDDPAVECKGPAKLGPILADMANMPDAAMTLAAVACFAEGTSILRGLGTLRHKETDRLAAMKNELTKVGVAVKTSVAGDEDAITITPPPGGVDCSADCERVEFETYDDHRMAMSLALVGLRRPNVWIKNPACVNKTYPGFWGDLEKLYK